MRKSFLNTAMASSLVLFSVQAGAVPFSSFDPRSFAMGGVGVASGTSANAGFVNPALLAAAHEDEDFAVEIPMLHFRVADPDDLVDEIDNYQDNDLEAELTAAVDAFNTGGIPTTEEAQAVGRAADALLSQLLVLSDKALQGEFVGGFVVGIPSKRFGASLTANVRAVGGGFLQVTDADQTLVNGISSDAAGGPIQLASNPAIQDQATGTEDIVEKLTSNLQTKGAVLTEIGVSLAREFEILGEDVAIGITPKYVQVNTFDYQVDVQTADFDAEEGKKEYTDFNFDIGAAKDFGNGWKAGLTIKNLIGQEYETATGGLITIDPQARVGISHQNEWVAVGFDADLNSADPVGYEEETQYVGIGAELDLWDTAQLRLGYRHNLKDSDTSVPTVGMGLSPFGIHMDLALAANDDEVAFSGQLGFRF